ncbi:hypothetical protein QF022_000405 [Vogesella perlucida]|nr:hypothetical protein [Vogesella perlucida]
MPLSRRRRPPCAANLSRQRGMAALLLVLLTGMSMSALTLGVMHYVRAAQDSNQAVHARTQAQINAWAGVEALRQYLQGKQTTDLAALDELAVRRADGSELARIRFQPGCANVAAGAYCFRIVGRSANSTATLEAGLQLTAASQDFARLGSALAVNGGLNVSGNLFQVINGSSGLGGVAVDGDINIEKISSSASSPTCASGNIKIGGNGQYTGSYLAGGDIWVFGGANARDVSLQARSVVIGGNAEDGRVRPGGASRYQRISYQQFLATGPIEIDSAARRRQPVRAVPLAVADADVGQHWRPRIHLARLQHRRAAGQLPPGRQRFCLQRTTSQRQHGNRAAADGGDATDHPAGGLPDGAGESGRQPPGGAGQLHFLF